MAQGKLKQKNKVPGVQKQKQKGKAFTARSRKLYFRQAVVDSQCLDILWAVCWIDRQLGEQQ